MKKIYFVVLLILILSVKSCKSTNEEILFLRTKTINTISEGTFINSMEKSNYNLKEVMFDNEEEFKNYIHESMEMKKLSSKKKIASGEFSKTGATLKNLVYINPQEMGLSSLNIDQKGLSYIFGLISGMVSRTNSVSIVYSKNLRDSNENILAFLSGIKKVNLRAYDLIRSGENVLDTSLLEGDNISSQTQEFLNKTKSDIVFYLSDNQNIIDNLKSTTVFTLNEFYENGYLKFSYDYENLIKNLFKGNEDFKKYDLSIFSGNISINTEHLPSEVKNIVDNALNNIKQGILKIPSNLDELKNS